MHDDHHSLLELKRCTDDIIKMDGLYVWTFITYEVNTFYHISDSEISGKNWGSASLQPGKVIYSSLCQQYDTITTVIIRVVLVDTPADYSFG